VSNLLVVFETDRPTGLHMTSHASHSGSYLNQSEVGGSRPQGMQPSTSNGGGRYHSPPNQGQIVCGGCRTLLLHPHGAQNVRCALCSHVTPVQSATDMAQLVCGHCRTLLMYLRGATNVQCSVCHTLNYVGIQNHPLAHVNCGGCQTMLAYSHGAHSVKCSVCNYITQVGSGNNNQTHSQQQQQQQQQHGHPAPQTVLVENPPTLDDEGRLLSNNMAVGVSEGNG